MIEMTEDEKNIVAFVEGKKDCISPFYEELKVYGPEDEPSPGDLKIVLRIPVKNGRYKDYFNLLLLHKEDGSVDACAEVSGIHMLDEDGLLPMFRKTSTFINFGQEKSLFFKNWLKDVFFEWYRRWEGDFLKSKRERYEREKEEKFKWLPDEKSRAFLGELVKGFTK